MVTSQYEWKILEWDEETLTNKNNILSNLHIYVQFFDKITTSCIVRKISVVLTIISEAIFES